VLAIRSLFELNQVELCRNDFNEVSCGGLESLSLARNAIDVGPHRKAQTMRMLRTESPLKPGG